MKVILAISGGLDSVVAMHSLKSKGHDLRASFLNFGKKSGPHEMAAAKRACLELAVPLEIVDVRGLLNLQLGYVPWDHIEVDELDIKIPEIVESNPISGFAILMTILQYYALLVKSDAVAFGIIEEQHAHRPHVYDMGTPLKLLQTYLSPGVAVVEFDFPLKGLSKPEVIKLGQTLKVKMEDTWSCLRDHTYHCGECAQCKSRKDGFRAANVIDNTTYLK